MFLSWYLWQASSILGSCDHNDLIRSTCIDPIAGAKDLQEITQDAGHVILFGITCGLSAPYVAGQIDYAMNQVSFSVLT